jgi:hypothetical protein
MLAKFSVRGEIQNWRVFQYAGQDVRPCDVRSEGTCRLMSKSKA